MGPKELLSVGLDFGGDSKRSVLFLKDNSQRFSKHLKEDGNLDLASLIADHTLKTTLILGQDYGPVVNEVLTKSDTGETLLRKEHTDHISLMVPKDTLQLAEMLAAKRFDYGFSDSISEVQLKRAKLDLGLFESRVYEQTTVASAHDPNLITSSVRCNQTALSRRAMPSIDSQIRFLRQRGWEEIQRSHRKKVDESFVDRLLPWETLGFRLQTAIMTNEVDLWKPKDSQEQKPPPRPPFRALKRASRDPSFQIIPFKEGLIFATPSSASLVRSNPPWRAIRTSIWDMQPPRSLELGHHLDDDEATALLAHVPSSLQSPFHFDLNSALTADLNSGLNSSMISVSTSRLVIYAQGLEREEFISIANSVPWKNLIGLKVFGASQQTTQWILENLPAHLRHLSLVQCDFKGLLAKNATLSNVLQKLRLETLDLSSSVLPAADLAEILNRQSLTLKTLRLIHHVNALRSQAVIEALTRPSPHWDQLKIIDLSKNQIYGGRTQALSKRLGKLDHLEELYLEANFFDPADFRTLFKTKAPLKILYADYNRLSSPHPGEAPRIPLPSSLHTLVARSCGLDDGSLQRIRFPEGLKVLNLAGNALSDGGLIELADQLAASHLHFLDLSSNSLSKNALESFFGTPKNSFLHSLELLALNDLKIEDSLIPLLSSFPKLREFAAKKSKITDVGLTRFPTQFQKQVTRLELAAGHFTDAGISSFLQSTQGTLKFLDLSQMPHLSGRLWPKHLPEILSELNIANNAMTEPELALLLSQKLPRLTRLQISANSFGPMPARALSNQLAQNLTQTLAELFLSSTFESYEEVLDFIQTLPNSVQHLSLWGVHGSAGPETSGATHSAGLSTPLFLPKRLVTFEIRGSWPDPFWRPLIQGMPGTLRTLAGFGAPLSQEGIESLLTFLPGSSVDELLVGLPKGSSPSRSFASQLPQTLTRFETFGAINPILRDGIPEGSLFALYDLGSYELPVQHDVSHKGAQRGSQLASGIHSGIVSAIVSGRTPPPRPPINLWLSGPGVNDAFARDLVKNFHPIQFDYLQADSSSLTADGILTFLRAMPLDSTTLSLRSSHLKLKDLDAVIQNLPPGLRSFGVTGNRLGAVGIEKLRRWKNAQEKRLGFPIDFVE